MKKHNGVKHSMQLKSISRRRGVIERLTAQLKSKVKEDNVPLNEGDITRINKELTVLKSRV